MSVRRTPVNHEPPASPGEMPLNSEVAYRPIAEAAASSGQGIALSGDGIRFRGPRALKPGTAAEVRIAPVRGLSPPLTAYIEVSRCDAEPGGEFRIAGVIKGIRSE